MAERYLKREDLAKLIDSVCSGEGLFVGPKMDGRQVVYAPISAYKDIVFDYIVPRNSFKEFLFPQTEVIARYAVHKDGIDLQGVKAESPEMVVFGSRPCDAASVASLRSVFTWDFVDTSYTEREDRMVIMTIACTDRDEGCFCSTVNLAPDSVGGSDLFLKETLEGGYLVDIVTDRGRTFVERFEGIFSAGGADVDIKRIADVPRLKGVDVKKIKEDLRDTSHYDNDDLWAGLTRKCIGCGACTFVCPTCHCFDIADEGSALEGERRKNWDACQFDHFTLHASGHNPRDTQYKRWRNRFMCKFNFYPNKFSSRGCVGCGRCIRVCPVGLDITEVMEEMSGR